MQKHKSMRKFMLKLGIEVNVKLLNYNKIQSWINGIPTLKPSSPIWNEIGYCKCIHDDCQVNMLQKSWFFSTMISLWTSVESKLLTIN